MVSKSSKDDKSWIVTNFPFLSDENRKEEKRERTEMLPSLCFFEEPAINIKPFKLEKHIVGEK